MEEDFLYIELFDIYKNLLTEKQREVFSSRYLFDLSLSEIAEPNGLTRQSVHDIIKKVKEKLSEYESLLGIYSKYKKIEEISNETLDEKTKKELKEVIGK